MSTCTGVSGSTSTENRQRLKPWLLECLEKRRFPGLTWHNQQKNQFKIKWVHRSSSNWTADDCQVFEAWSRHKGHTTPLNDLDKTIENDSTSVLNGKTYKQMKNRLRSALNQADDILGIHPDSSTKHRCYRYYEFLEMPEFLSRKNSETSKSSYTGDKTPLKEVKTNSSMNEHLSTSHTCKFNHINNLTDFQTLESNSQNRSTFSETLNNNVPNIPVSMELTDLNINDEMISCSPNLPNNVNTCFTSVMTDFIGDETFENQTSSLYIDNPNSMSILNVLNSGAQTNSSEEPWLETFDDNSLKPDAWETKNGRYDPAVDNPDYSKMRSNFRSALNRSKYVRYIEQVESRNNTLHRIYEFDERPNITSLPSDPWVLHGSQTQEVAALHSGILTPPDSTSTVYSPSSSVSTQYPYPDLGSPIQVGNSQENFPTTSNTLDQRHADIPVMVENATLNSTSSQEIPSDLRSLDCLSWNFSTMSLSSGSYEISSSSIEKLVNGTGSGPTFCKNGKVKLELCVMNYVCKTKFLQKGQIYSITKNSLTEESTGNVKLFYDDCDVKLSNHADRYNMEVDRLRQIETSRLQPIINFFQLSSFDVHVKNDGVYIERPSSMPCRIFYSLNDGVSFQSLERREKCKILSYNGTSHSAVISFAISPTPRPSGPSGMLLSLTVTYTCQVNTSNNNQMFSTTTNQPFGAETMSVNCSSVHRSRSPIKELK